MSQPLAWGILGTGNIAGQFASGLTGAERGYLASVASRDADRARAFADRFHPDIHAFGRYEELLDDDAVQAVYVSLPNSLHAAWTIRALEAGKHVLCEKPLASDADEARQMFEAARRCDRHLVEAFMYRSHPLIREVKQAVGGGAIGDLRLIRTSFCFRLKKVEGNIRFDASLAGGALMDIGGYCVNFARFFAEREPTQIHAFAHRHASGVDEMACGSLHFDDTLLSSFTCAMNLQADNAAYLCGDEGYITVPIPWKPPAQGAVYHLQRMTPPKQDLARGVKAETGQQTITVDAGKPLYALEADDFAATVLDARPPVISEADSVGNMVILDELRRQVGVMS